MSQSFFDLAPHNDQEPDPEDVYVDYLYSLSDEELNDVIAEGEPIYDALHAALEAYATTHPEMSKNAVLYAADMFLGSIKSYLAEPDCDCDA